MPIFPQETINFRRHLRSFYKGVHSMYNIFQVHSIFLKCSMYGVCIVNYLTDSTYNMYKTCDGILHNFTTKNYSMREMSTQIIVPGHVQHSLPVLLEYHCARGMYDSSSSSSTTSRPVYSFF